MSGIVREEFRKLGHNAWSCDLLETEIPGKHIIGDIKYTLDHRYLGRYWDWNLMIAFPPCTYLCSSGLHWNKRRPGRQQQTEEALEFVQYLLDTPIEHIALENPIGCISTRIRKPDQIIQPYQFGHPESKATCLWLKNLPKLEQTELIFPTREDGRWDNQTASGQNKLGPSSTRAMDRARTYRGIAKAMSLQWSNL